MDQKGRTPNRARKINPADIALPPGFGIEPYIEGLTTPINLTFSEKGEMLVADSGILSGSGKVLRLGKNGPEMVAEGFKPPLTGITCYKGDIYVAHRGSITAIRQNGVKVDILNGLPSWGDHHNNRVEFGADGKMYFGQGTATNSGVVGEDNESWVVNYPFFHDYPAAPLMLVGQNFESEDFLSSSASDTAITGAYSPFGVPGIPGEWIKGVRKASGSVLRANPDGSGLEVVAWGLRNPFRMKFDRYNRLFCTNHGMDVRGSRPVDNSPDEFHRVRYGAWYGWPDYTGGMPVTLPVFKPENHPQPAFLIANHPMIPPKPLVNFMPHSAIMGFDFNRDPAYGNDGDAYIAEFGSEAPETTGGKPLPGVGHRVTRIELQTGRLQTFAINKSGYAASFDGGGGFERPIDVVFGPDRSMYVVDFGLAGKEDIDAYMPGSGLIWRIRPV